MFSGLRNAQRAGPCYAVALSIYRKLSNHGLALMIASR